MNDIVGQEDFSIEDRPIYSRLDSVVFSARVGMLALLAIVFGSDWGATGLEFWRGLLLAMVIGIGLGLVIGLLAHGLERGTRPSASHGRLARIFAGDPTIVPPPPPAATHRLPCAVILPRQGMCGGVLYVAESGFIFQPNYPPRRWWQRGQPDTPEPLLMGPPGSITLGEGWLVRPHWLIRRIGAPRIPALLCYWDGGAAAFRVPRTRTVRDKLQTAIDHLRGQPVRAV